MQNYFSALDGACESELVTAAQAGSEDAFAELLKRSRPRLLRTAGYLLESPEEVEDAVQNACLKAYQHLATFRQDASFNTWLTKIALNQARMRLRELRRAKVISMDDVSGDRPSMTVQIPDCTQNPEHAASGDQMRAALHQEIRRLPAQLRQVMLLYVEDLSMPETAERLNVTLAAAKTRMLRARQFLNQRMRRYTDFPTVMV